MKHTNGPWSVEAPLELAHPNQWRLYSRECGTIAMVEGGIKNARLISAAPELLECAKLTLELIDSLAPVFAELDHKTKTHTTQISVAIQSVIDKATGGDE